MNAIEWIAEQRIREAVQAGKLDNLPGSGRPLRIDQDSHLPPDLRLVYTILKNASYLPPVIDLRRRIEMQTSELRQYLDMCARYAAKLHQTSNGPQCEQSRKGLFALWLSKPQGNRAKKSASVGRIQRYRHFRTRAFQEVQARIRRINALISEQQDTWYREVVRHDYCPRVDLSLVPIDEKEVMARLNELLPAIQDTEISEPL